MKLLLDTQNLLWATARPERLPTEATILISEEAARLYFSAASLWQVLIKNGLQRT